MSRRTTDPVYVNTPLAERADSLEKEALAAGAELLRVEEFLDTASPALSSALDLVGDEILRVNAGNGWNVTTPETWDERHANPYRVPAILALIHSEVSEALEAYRKGDKANFVEELADVFIRLLDLTRGLDVDLAGAVLAKLEQNRMRGYRHGGKLV